MSVISVAAVSAVH